MKRRAITRAGRGDSAPTTARHRHRGFALLSVLWLSVAIAAITLSLALDTHRDNLAATNIVESAQALAAARAGVATAISRLDRLTQGTEPPAFVPVTPNDPWEFCDTLLRETVYLNGPGSAGYQLRVQDLGAVLGINQATDYAWSQFFNALGVSADQSGRFAAEIADWRDPDDITRENGAERAEYQQAGAVALPVNTNIGSTDELLDLLGMTPAIYERARPYLTPLTNGSVGVNTAPYPVLATVPGFTQEVIAQILSRRQDARPVKSIGDLGLSSANPFLQNELTFTTQTVLITSMGWSPGGHTRVTETVQLQFGRPRSRVQLRRDYFGVGPVGGMTP